MVFESILVELLNRVLGPYVKNLDASQLRVGVWGGDVLLERLELKENALARFNVPFRIFTGHLGKLRLKVPWTNLYNAPVVAEVDGLYVIAGPASAMKYDPAKEAQELREEKEKQLNAVEEARKKEEEAAAAKDKVPEQDPGFVEKLITQVIKNVQVIVKNIHIRYEDTVTNPSKPFSFGVTLDGLSVQSTDDQYCIGGTSSGLSTLIYKLVDLTCLGLYWNSNVKPLSINLPEDWVNTLKDGIARPGNTPLEYNYVVLPITAQAKLQVSTKPGRQMDIPQFLVDVILQEVGVALSKQQYVDVMAFVGSFDRLALSKKFQKYRPAVPLSKDKRAWWHYAITAVVEEDVKRRLQMWSWKYIVNHLKLCKRYEKKYREKLQTLSPSSALLQEIQLMEDEMDVFNILYYRKLAKKKHKEKAQEAVSSPRPVPSAKSAPHQAVKTAAAPLAVKPSPSDQTGMATPPGAGEAAPRKKVKEKKEKKGFFSRWTKKKEKQQESVAGAAASDAATPAPSTTPSAPSAPSGSSLQEEKEKQAFYNEIGYVEGQSTELPKEYVAHEVNLNLKTVTVELTGKKGKLGLLTTKNVGATVCHRPTSEGVSVVASVGGMVMTGVPRGDTPTTMLSYKEQEEGVHLVDFRFELNPVEGKKDVVVKASLQPIEIIYDGETVDGLIESFRVQKDINLIDLTSAASATWHDLKSQATVSLKDAMKTRKHMDLDVKLHSPYIILPEKGIYSKDASLLVVDLGLLSMTSVDVAKGPGDPKFSEFYDKFNIELQDLQVLVAKPGENWQRARSKHTSPMHIVESTGFSLSLEKNISQEAAAFLPSVKIDGVLQSFEVILTDKKIITLLKIATSIEVPPSLSQKTDFYNVLPPRPVGQSLHISPSELIDTMSVDNMSIISLTYDEDEDEDEDEDDSEPEGESVSLSPHSESVGEEGSLTARHIYTDVMINLVIMEVGVKLFKEKERTTVKKGRKKSSSIEQSSQSSALAAEKTSVDAQREPLLEVKLRSLKSEVFDRKWDSRGSVSMKEVSIKDYITKDADGKPTDLLLTETLQESGNFILLKFTQVSKQGTEFAAQYTGLEDSVEVQLSTVKLNLQRTTIANLLQLGKDVASSVKSLQQDKDQSSAVEEGRTRANTGAMLKPTKEKTGFAPPKKMDLHFDACFDGVSLSLCQQAEEIVRLEVIGFAVKGRVQPNLTHVTASMENLLIQDPSPSANVHQIVSKADDSTKMISLEFNGYTNATKRSPNDLSVVNSELKAEIQRLNAIFDPQFLSKIMEFVRNLKLDSEDLMAAARVTADKATATAIALKNESVKISYRMKLDISLHAPLLTIPYTTKSSRGELVVDLGDLRVSNCIMSGTEFVKGREDVTMISLKTHDLVLDRMMVEFKSITVFRRSCNTDLMLTESSSSRKDDKNKHKEQFVILHPLQFTVFLTRNLTSHITDFPKITVELQLGEVKLHLQDEDVQAIVNTALSSANITQLTEGELLRKQPSAEKQKSAALRPDSSPSMTARSTWKRINWSDIIEVKVQARLKALYFQLSTKAENIFSATASGLSSEVALFSDRVEISASVDSVNVTDLGEGVTHSTIVSLAEHTDKVSTVKMVIYTKEDMLPPFSPLGDLKATVSQLQLVLSVPFILRIVDFAKRIDINTGLLINAAKAAQGGALAMKTVVVDKYVLLALEAHAPVVIVPLGEDLPQGLVIDMGELHVSNECAHPEPDVGVDAYSIKLQSFKMSRAILNFENEGPLVKAERVLLQPFSLNFTVARNLCSWYTKVPTVQLAMKVDKLKFCIGQEDIETMGLFGTTVGKKVSEYIEKAGVPSVDKEKMKAAITELATKESSGKTKDQEESPSSSRKTGKEGYKMVDAEMSLGLFEIKLYKNEPKLEVGNSSSMQVSESFSLASMQLVGMKLTAVVMSDERVDVEASLMDMALLDEQPSSLKKRTGNRIIQHYSSNPLNAYTGKIEHPTIVISYHLQFKAHFVIIKVGTLLAITDLEFMTTMRDYFTAVGERVVPPSASSISSSEGSSVSLSISGSSEEDMSKTLVPVPSSGETAAAKKEEEEEEGKKEKAAPSALAGGFSFKSLPKIKVEAVVKDFRVAIIEDVDSEDPQALQLKVSTFLHFQLLENSKQLSLNIVDFGVASSRFFDLDNTTSWILLPCSLYFNMSGPLDDLVAMDIMGNIEPIVVTLSPAIIRLVTHAVKTLTPEKKVKKEPPPPVDLWNKTQLKKSKFWFFMPVPMMSKTKVAVTEEEKKGLSKQSFTLTLQSVELVLESDSTVEEPHGHPVLALNVSAEVTLADFIGKDLSVKGVIKCESSYYSERLSVWEPLLEPLESKEGNLFPWQIKVEAGFQESAESASKTSLFVSFAAEYPLQITLTKSSLQLMSSLAEAYSKEYGKKMEGSVSIQSLTGSPFTIVNKLSTSVNAFIKPGPSLKLKDASPSTKLSFEEKADFYFLKPWLVSHSHASLITQQRQEVHTVDIVVGSFKCLEAVPISSPGTFFYQLVTQKQTEKMYGLVVEVAVTGTKKTVTLRSSLQVFNHLSTEVELLTENPRSGGSGKTQVAAIRPNQVYPVPIEMALENEFFVQPSGCGYKTSGPGFTWVHTLESEHYQVDTSSGEEDAEPCYFITVSCKEEHYKSRKNLPTSPFPHHIFHLYSPLVIQNLLPYTIAIQTDAFGSPLHHIKPGMWSDMHEVSLSSKPLLSVNVQGKGLSLRGKVELLAADKSSSRYSTFPVSKDDDEFMNLSLHTEAVGYHRVSIYSPFWMINKTGMTLKYKDGPKVETHPSEKEIVLLSCSNKHSKIQLGAITEATVQTDWTKAFALNAVGSSGNFSAKALDISFQFGVEVRLSQFTLTKVVTITPYFLLVNRTEHKLLVQPAEINSSFAAVTVPPGELVPYWPMSNSSQVCVSVDLGNSVTTNKSVAFNYRKSTEFTVLQMDDPVRALCVEVQEAESSSVITFSPYYPGCVPVQVVNHFRDLTLRFRQDSRSHLVLEHVLPPGEAMVYTWDDPGGRKALKWILVGSAGGKPIDVTKDGEGTYPLKISSTSAETLSVQKSSSDMWLSIEPDASLTEELISVESNGQNSSTTSSNRGYWKAFINGLQRVLLFTPNEDVISRIRASGAYCDPLFEASLTLKGVGLSLVDNQKKRELAYIAIIQSGLIWQVEKGHKGHWKTLNHELIAVLEQAHQNGEQEIKSKHLVVNIVGMEMFSPVRGRLRRTHHDGIHTKFSITKRDYRLYAKMGYVQVDNQLPFSVYPQVIYPLPPPPTVASTVEPKPFFEASIVLRRNEKLSVKHFNYVHVLIQKMAVNVDLGFILSLVDFFSIRDSLPSLEKELVESEIEYNLKSLKENVLAESADDVARFFFDVLHLAPIKVSLSFNVRSVGRNKSKEEHTAGDRFLELFLHSLGVILTSVQDIEMKFSCFHLEYQPETQKHLIHLLIRHYKIQGLYQLHTLILGLDVLGNPVSVVRGVVEGTIDLFYEPIKGSVLGPEEFFEGLGIGLKSFFGGTVGGLTGAGARVTGAVGDVFAKLTFDDEFIDKRQQGKTKSSKLGFKLGGFAKNVFEGVTGVVTQPVKGLQKEGAVGLLKGTGRGLVGLLVRPTGGLIDLTSGTLHFVTKKTKVGNIEIEEIRPPRFIGRDGVVSPYSPPKALGNALLEATEEGRFVDSDYYFGHMKVSDRPIKFLIVTDRRFIFIERRKLTEGWNRVEGIQFRYVGKPVQCKGVNIVIAQTPDAKGNKLHSAVFQSEKMAKEAADLINESYAINASECYRDT